MTEVALVGLGLAAGILGSILGIGGGIVFVPALVTLFAIAQHDAQGTSLVVIVPTTLVGAYMHSRAGRVDWRSAAILGTGGIIGGVLGARTALALDAPLLKRMFAVFLVVAAVRMLGKTRRGTPVPTD